METLSNLDPKSARFYGEVPEESLNRLLAFRERFPYQTVELNSRQWHFIDTQHGDTTLFIPAGGTMIAEISFRSIEHFAQQHRVITPDYPEIENLSDLFNGFVSLLDHLGIGPFYLMGGSYGGWMAQSFVRHAPERVRKVVLSAIGPPNPENSRQLGRLMPFLRFLPMPLLRALIQRSFSRLDSDQGADPDMALLKAHVQEVMDEKVQRSDFLAGMQRLIDQTTNYTFTPEDLADWQGQMLLLFGSEDPATPADKREAMRRLYPQAEMRVIEGAGHGMAVTHREEYYGTIDAFLATEGAAACYP